MRRIFRDIVPLVSTVVAIAALALAAVSYQHRNDCWEFSTLHAHYTVWWGDGQVRITGPSSALLGAAQPQAWQLLKDLRNDQIDFVLAPDPFGGARPAIAARAHPGTPAAALAALPVSSSLAALLRGLDSPNKFAAADLLLERTLWLLPPDFSYAWLQEGQHNVKLRAYHFTVPPDLDLQQPSSASQSVLLKFPGNAPPIGDLDKLNSIRRQWHLALDVQIFRFSYSWIIGSASVLPIVRLPSLWRSRLRRRCGRCGQCGYDIRFTPEDQSRYPLNYASRFRADRGY